jgi:hypothetical protein
VGFVGRKYADHRVAVLAGIGGLLTLSVVHAQQLSFAWRASERGRTPSGPWRNQYS